VVICGISCLQTFMAWSPQEEAPLPCLMGNVSGVLLRVGGGGARCPRGNERRGEEAVDASEERDRSK